MRESVRETLITWAFRLGFAFVGVMTIYLLVFGS
jgi:hypothetical protein